MNEHIVKRYRRFRGDMSLQALAEAATALLPPDEKISASAISQWETGGTARPDRDNVAAVDAVLEADGAILAYYGFKRPEDEDSATLLTAAVRAVVELREAVTVLSERVEQQARLGAERQRLIDELTRRLDDLAP